MTKQGDIIQRMLESITKNLDEVRSEDIAAHKDISENFSSINKHIANIDVTQAKQNVVLEEHIRRTELAEKSIEDVQKRIAPIEKHISMWAGAGKLLAILGIVSGIAGVIVKLVLK